MYVRVDRAHFYPGACIGRLFIDDKLECFVLEDAVREIENVPVEDWKIPGRTAIPYGKYRLTVDQSLRFGKPMPHVLDVPGFSAIRIHAGNRAEDTEGCLLLGRVWNPAKPEEIAESRLAFGSFFPKLQAALNAGEECWITVRRAEERPRALQTSATAGGK